MHRWLASVTALVLLLAACGAEDAGGDRGGDVDLTKPFLQPDGPLRGLIMATGAGDDGSINDPRFRFTTDDTQGDSAHTARR